MKVIPADLQRVWHYYVGVLVENKSILDIGSGRGKSKERLELGDNTVTTHDINRALMTQVDMVEDTRYIRRQKWDIVTAFDVVEHVVYPVPFLCDLHAIARESVFVTTPNWHKHPRPWHYTPEQFLRFFDMFEHCSLRFFARYRSRTRDYVQELEKYRFMEDRDIYAFGLWLIK